MPFLSLLVRNDLVKLNNFISHSEFNFWKCCFFVGFLQKKTKKHLEIYYRLLYTTRELQTRWGRRIQYCRFMYFFVLFESVHKFQMDIVFIQYTYWCKIHIVGVFHWLSTRWLPWPFPKRNQKARSVFSFICTERISLSRIEQNNVTMIITD